MSAYPLANLALAAFPFVAIWIFKRFSDSAAFAAALVVVGGTLFLPEVRLIDIRGIPYIDKDRIVYISALLGLLFHHPARFWGSRPVLIAFGMVLLFLIVNFATRLYNLYPLVNEGQQHDGLSITWLIGQMFADILTIVLPFLVARAAIRSPDDLRNVLYVLVAGGLIYTVLITIEVMMGIPWFSFQFSYYIYGVPGQRPLIKFGLTEPVVFLDTGHAVATFMLVALIAGLGLLAARAPLKWFGLGRIRLPLIAGSLLTLKVGSNLMALTAVFVFRIFGPQAIARIAMAIGCLVLLYPAMRFADIFPYEAIVEIVQQYDEERARSFRGRFDEEYFVLGGLGDRLWVGWGHFGRVPGAASFGGDSGEPGLDAWWVIRAGNAGLAGVVIYYLFMLVPVVRARRHMKLLGSAEAAYVVAATMVCVSVRMLDLLLNGWWNSLPVFLAGALVGSLAILSSSEVRLRGRSPNARNAGSKRGERAPRQIGTFRKKGVRR